MFLVGCEWNNLSLYVLEVLKLLLNHVCVFHNFILFLCEFLFLLDNVLIFLLFIFRTLVHIGSTSLTSFSGHSCVLFL